MITKKLLLVGLGNPGIKYELTRHNLGADWIKKFCLSKDRNLKFNNSLFAKLTELNPNVICMIPEDYINNSGFAIKKTMDYYKIEPSMILVVHDDLTLASGDLKFKNSGGHGGHNGIRHIIEILQTKEFKRLRIGIGQPQSRDQIVDYVLSRPDQQQRSMIDKAIQSSINIISGSLNNIEIDWQKIALFLQNNNPKFNNFSENNNGI